MPNFVISNWNKYVLRSGWAQVSFDYMLHFYEHEQEFDNDYFQTNFFLHPYQGSLSYMAARNSNLNLTESFLCGAASSFLWEYFGETNAPSINDLIYTSIGCVPVGEILFRLSVEASRKNKISPIILDPLYIYTDPINGRSNLIKPGHITSNTARLLLQNVNTFTHYSSDEYSGFVKDPSPFNMMIETNIVYGNPYGHESNEPYSQFDLNAGVMFGTGENSNITNMDVLKYIMYDFHIFSNGMIFSYAPDFGENKDTTIGLGLDYDFIWSSYFLLSTLSPGFVIKQLVRNEDFTNEYQFHLDYNILGTSDYYFLYHKIIPDAKLYREYSYNTGLQSVFSWKLTTPQKKTLSTGLRFYALYDFKGQKQKVTYSGWDLVFMSNVSGEMPLSEKLSLGCSLDFYNKIGLYEENARVFQNFITTSIFLRIKSI